ncbi:acylphosphatase [Methanosarcina sp.]
MISGEIVRAEVLVSGRVQGVGFRRFEEMLPISLESTAAP